MSPIARRFFGRRRDAEYGDRLPPGQYTVGNFPVLTAGPTPRAELDEWTFSIKGAVEPERTWTWKEFRALRSETVTKDIHCVTKWSKFDTVWDGVSVDTLLEGLEPSGGFITAFCDGGYTTNLPLADVTGGKAWIAFGFGGEPLERKHGGPARLLVPHLYLWKSAKWVRGLEITDADVPGFWEVNGYHNRGDPWREERYWGD